MSATNSIAERCISLANDTASQLGSLRRIALDPAANRQAVGRQGDDLSILQLRPDAEALLAQCSACVVVVPASHKATPPLTLMSRAVREQVDAGERL